jgi:hypothetical protein
VAADDLARRVALDTLRTRIPAGDDPVRIQHVNGVILHVLDQQPEAIRLLPAPFGITDRAKAGSLFVEDRGESDVAMFGADARKYLLVDPLEAVHRVAAEQAKRTPMTQTTPEAFELERSMRRAVSAKNVHHLAVESNRTASVVASGAVENAVRERLENRRIG